MRPYSQDLRERVVRAVDEKQGTREEIAQRFGVSDRWIRLLLRRRKETGSLATSPHGGGRSALYAGPKLNRLRRVLQRKPDATLEELRTACGGQGSLTALWRGLRRLGVTRKKSRSARPSRTGRT
jgi:transposase